jgi:hypothetical protein
MGCSGLSKLSKIYARDNIGNVPVGLKQERREKYCLRILAVYFDTMALCGHIEESALKRMKDSEASSIRKIKHSIWSPLEWLQKNY